MKSAIRQFTLLIFFTFNANAVAEIPASLHQLAEMMGVEVTTLRFKDDTGKNISAQEFTVFTGQQRSFDIIKQKELNYLVINPLNAKSDTGGVSQANELLVTKTTTTFPEFELRSTNGKTSTKQDFHGKPTLISFYFSTCLPCIEEVPALNSLRANLSEQLNFIAITYEDSDTALNFAKKYQFDWDSLINAEQLIKQIGIPAYPAFVLLDEQGNTLNARVGNATENTENALRQWLNESGVVL